VEIRAIRAAEHPHAKEILLSKTLTETAGEKKKKKNNTANQLLLSSSEAGKLGVCRN